MEKIDYGTWYNSWMKMLAKTKSKEYLVERLGCLSYELSKASASHLRAIQATASMQGSSQRRAQSRNVVSALGEERMAIEGAFEIYEKFPEHTLDGAKDSTVEGKSEV